MLMKLHNISHPSQCIDHKLTGAIRSCSAKAEAAGSLQPEQLSIIYQNKWFKLFVPENYGGLQLSLPEALMIEEALSWIDGSLGWTVTLCSGANWFIGFLKPGIAKLIFNADTVCLAGSGRPSGSATITHDGYEVTGHWSYASGAAHATAFTANCVIEKKGSVLKDKDGDPVIKSFLFLRDEVVIHDDWNCTGMLATSSNSFEVQRVRVDENRRFVIDNKFAVINEPIYQYPFLQFAEATLAVNISGMAIHFTDLCEAIFMERVTNNNYNSEINTIAITFLKNGQQALEDIRKLFYEAIQTSWLECAGNNTISLNLLDAVSKKSKELVSVSRTVVDQLYPYCGLIAANRHSEINRVWRDFHTATQHSLLT